MKNLNIERVQVPLSNDDTPLKERVKVLESLFSEFITAVKVDLSMIDIQNFSQHGVNQIDKMIKDKIGELGDV